MKKHSEKILNKHLPRHVGIIMDGNRRWAKQHGLSTLEGHQKGYKRALEITRYAFERGIQHISLFAFSTENWRRSKSEVSYLMTLVQRLLESEVKKLHAEGVRVTVLGSSERLSPSLRASIRSAEALTKDNSRHFLHIAFNHGGRQEIVEGVRALIAKKVKPGDIDEELITQSLWTSGIPEPDLIIRTSGEERLSGFLLWQAAYSELYFSKTLWPAFAPAEFDESLTHYARRKRNFGA